MRRIVHRVVLAGLVLVPGRASAGDAGDAALPWGKGRGSLGAGAGVSISSSLTVVTPGLRGGYFVVDGLELGGEIDLGVLMWSAADFTAHPGLANTVPGLALRVTPTIRYVFLRQPGFSPYLLAGVGPTWWNHRDGVDGVAGHWTASPGALILLGQLGDGSRRRSQVYLDLAIRFSSSFPGRSCHRAFTAGGGFVAGYCGFQFGPRLGFAVAF